MNRQIRIVLNYFLGPVILVLLSWSLYRQLLQQPDLLQRWTEISGSLKDLRLWLVVVLMVANWGMESWKWMLLVREMQPGYSFGRAFRAVLAGCSITMLTPNRIGEYGGRMLFVEPENRLRAISLALVGSISQLLITLIAGVSALIILRYFLQPVSGELAVLPHFWGDVLLGSSTMVMLLVALFYWKIAWLAQIIDRLPFMKRVQQHVSVIETLQNLLLAKILSLSGLRYLIFVAQYLLMLQLMGVNLPWFTGCCLIALFYLMMALAPTIGFIELPLRVGALWLLLKPYSGNELGVGAAALGIWIINLVLPAITGSLFLLRIRIQEKGKCRSA